MSKSNALSAEGVVSVQIPRGQKFEVKDGPDTAKTVVIGETGHQHELVIRLVEDSVEPEAADVEHVTVQAAGVTKGKSANATVESSGLSIIAGCPMHPFRFVIDETRGEIRVACICFVGSNVWEGVDDCEEHTGTVTWNEEEIRFKGAGEFSPDTEKDVGMPRE